MLFSEEFDNKVALVLDHVDSLVLPIVDREYHVPVRFNLSLSRVLISSGSTHRVLVRFSK